MGKYTRAEQLDAVRTVKAMRAHGKAHELPAWMFEARLEYKREWNNAHPRRSPERTAALALPEDKIIDWTAIDIVCRGERAVQLTHSERVLAAARMLREGLQPQQISDRMGVRIENVSRLLKKVRENDAEARILAALAAGSYEQSPEPVMAEGEKAA